jgi:toxin ParE1/3/4
MGRRRDELRKGLRSFPHGRYVIFYRIGEPGVQIVRVLEGERDLPPLLEND